MKTIQAGRTGIITGQDGWFGGQAGYHATEKPPIRGGFSFFRYNVRAIFYVS